MAFANYFDRSATAASQVLANFRLDDFKHKLSEHAVALSFDDAAVGSSEGRATLDLAIRLLARLYPVLSIHSVGPAAQEHRVQLRRLALSINDQLELRDGLADIVVAVGDSKVPSGHDAIYIGSEGWRALLSQDGPVGSGPTSNPFGAGAAACFGAANVFRKIFADQLSRGDLDDQIDLSLLTYLQGAAGEPMLPESIDLGDAYLVGLGAIGNGALWALPRISGLGGTLHVVDHERADLSNLQRYVMTTQDDVGRRKTSLARACFEQSRLKIKHHPQRWADYVDACRRRSFERVAVALDTAEDRIALQASLPKWIVNAWTQDVDLGVSRHGFGDDEACLACLYMPTGLVKNEHERVAEELRIPDAHMDIRTLLQTRQPVSESFVQRVATAFGVPFDALQAFVGQPIQNFYRTAVCGGLMVGLTGGAHVGTAVVPMAFQSALAGIMLAADLVKHAARMPVSSATTTRINLLRPLAPFLSDPRAKDSSGRCICCDRDFLEAYRLRYRLDRQRPAQVSADTSFVSE
ncbi:MULTISPECIES: E2 ligase fold family C protein [unclassified Bradyrhizobium]|uniref:E2 ligase fold family C protein n=1 Tax=unclassified Bradyrhizobium TaxID=2631580 RepID=UPI00291621FC|nr:MULTISPECIES: E2 ligase fold family C protein [unclassified Bradyrhizobium]